MDDIVDDVLGPIAVNGVDRRIPSSPEHCVRASPRALPARSPHADGPGGRPRPAAEHGDGHLPSGKADLRRRRHRHRRPLGQPVPAGGSRRQDAATRCRRSATRSTTPSRSPTPLGRQPGSVKTLSTTSWVTWRWHAACQPAHAGARGLGTFNVTRTIPAGAQRPARQHGDGAPTPRPASPTSLTASDGHSVNLFQPSITIDKTGDTLSKVGDPVNYTITVTNT